MTFQVTPPHGASPAPLALPQRITVSAGYSDCLSVIYDMVMKVVKAVQNFFWPTPSIETSTSSAIATSSTPTVTMNANPRNLIRFYHGFEANNNGATLEQMLQWDDLRLEQDHNYIQWLFPLDTQSGANPTAPILDQATMLQFRNNHPLQIQLSRSFRRMLTFYGLHMENGVYPPNIQRDQNFNARAAIWLTPPNHNFLRITRIIRSLHLLGKPDEGRALLRIMEDILQNEGAGIIASSTMGHWRNASQ